MLLRQISYWNGQVVGRGGVGGEIEERQPWPLPTRGIVVLLPSPTPSFDNQNVIRHRQVSSGGKKTSP